MQELASQVEVYGDGTGWLRKATTGRQIQNIIGLFPIVIGGGSSKQKDTIPDSGKLWGGTIRKARKAAGGARVAKVD